MKRTTWETTKRDFEKFVKYCNQEIVKHRLGNWVVAYEHCEIDDGDLAEVEYTMKLCDAIIRLGLTWDAKITDSKLRMVAYHEVMHLVLCKLRDLAEMRYVQGIGTIEDEEHIVINVLAGARFGPLGVCGV
jgi:hypothetical protein